MQIFLPTLFWAWISANSWAEAPLLSATPIATVPIANPTACRIDMLNPCCLIDLELINV
ncbi:MAG: hypothetical protein ACK5JT_16680 [Hyphomicrobiaceae bacterium]